MKRLNEIKWAKLLLTILYIGEAVFIGVKTGSILKGLLAWVITWFIGCLIAFGIIMWRFANGDTGFVDEACEEMKYKFHIDE